jgi:hypothetical protein
MGGLHANFLADEAVGNSNLHGSYCLISKFWSRKSLLALLSFREGSDGNHFYSLKLRPSGSEKIL